MTAPRMLVIGPNDENSFEGETNKLISASTGCTLLPKTFDRELMAAAEKADFIVFRFYHSPAEARQRDEHLLKQLKPHESNLLLFTDNMEEMSSIAHELGLHPFKTFSVSTNNSWQKQLYDTIIKWMAGRAGPKSENEYLILAKRTFAGAIGGIPVTLFLHWLSSQFTNG